MAIESFSELIRFIQFVPFRLSRIFEILIGRKTPTAIKYDDLFDILHKTDTAVPMKVYKLDAVTGSYIHSYGYAPSDTNQLTTVLASLPIRRDQFNFIDIGCGKGRALIVAEEMGFRTVTGIEISPRLCAIARRNLAICRINGLVLNLDAAKYQIPDDPCVLFLYSPFNWWMTYCFRRAVELRLARSDEALWIVYLSPRCRRVLEGSKKLRVFDDSVGAVIYTAAL